MEYVYAAIFEPNDDGTFTITFPDFPGCISEGKSLPNTLYMAEKALTQRLEYLSDKGENIPNPTRTSEIKTGGDEIVNLINGYIRDTALSDVP
jgi:predicted RNase H-like HicB family nuclease